MSHSHHTQGSYLLLETWKTLVNGKIVFLWSFFFYKSSFIVQERSNKKMVKLGDKIDVFILLKKPKKKKYS